jgi:hypothetical protein
LRLQQFSSGRAYPKSIIVRFRELGRGRWKMNHRWFNL